MKIIVATDSYKGTISASDASAIIAEAFSEKLPLAKVIKMPIADGGEGSAACFVDAMGGSFITTNVKNCFFENTSVRFGLIERGETAVIEIAQAAGLHFAEGRKNPMLTTTYGVGQMIAAAAELGVKRIWLCLGGSATNDLGLGAAAALGVRFTGADGEDMLPLGGTLDELCGIDVSGVPDSIRTLEISCLCDVTGTLTGEAGAARMFAAQKGARPKSLKYWNAAPRMCSRFFCARSAQTCQNSRAAARRAAWARGCTRSLARRFAAASKKSCRRSASTQPLQDATWWLPARDT